MFELLIQRMLVYVSKDCLIRNVQDTNGTNYKSSTRVRSIHYMHGYTNKLTERLHSVGKKDRETFSPFLTAPYVAGSCTSFTEYWG